MEETDRTPRSQRTARSIQGTSWGNSRHVYKHKGDSGVGWSQLLYISLEEIWGKRSILGLRARETTPAAAIPPACEQSQVGTGNLVAAKHVCVPV